MKYKAPDMHQAYKRQKNYTNRLLQREKKIIFGLEPMVEELTPIPEYLNDSEN